MKKFSKIIYENVNKEEPKFSFIDSLDKVIEYNINEYDNFLDYMMQFLDLDEIDGEIEFESFREEFELSTDWLTDKEIYKKYNVLEEAYGHIYPHILFLKNFIKKHKDKSPNYIKKMND
jgi:hypothetical protein